MRLIQVAIVVAGAALCGYWAWRRTTRNMYYRSPNSTIRPPEVSLEDYDEWVMVRRRRWRAAKSALAAAIGAAVTLLIVTMVDSAITRR